MYSWYVLWVDVQVTLQSSDRLIKITQTESGAVPVMTFLQCHAPPLFPNKLQRIMYSWYVLWVDVQVNLQSSDRLIKKISDWKRGDSCYDVTLPYMETPSGKVDRYV